ncbi:MAG: glycoside hydrolase family 5 protein [Chloroflexi bacterium]|nr:glycoside hydrolase family 5 protein [Chloroflexota bacterium]
MPTTPQMVVNGALIAIITILLMGIWPDVRAWQPVIAEITARAAARAAGATPTPAPSPEPSPSAPAGATETASPSPEPSASATTEPTAAPAASPEPSPATATAAPAPPAPPAPTPTAPPAPSPSPAPSATPSPPPGKPEESSPTATVPAAPTLPAPSPTAEPPSPTPPPVAQQPGAPIYLTANGNRLVTGDGKEVKLTGINWFGMETGTFAPHGIWQRNWEELLDVVAKAGFNTIRLPFSNELFDTKSTPGLPQGIDFKLNPDLKGLTGIQVMDKIVEGAGKRGLKVLLDRHRPDQYGQSNLWYTGRVSEEQWIKDWTALAGRYLGNDAVIGADLHNEPHNEATWGNGDARTDWRLAAEKAGNAILTINPNWLIVVEGISDYEGKGFWWGGNLRGARNAPVRLNVPGRLVYSPHDYGPGVYVQNFFLDKTFPENMPGIWGEHWGYLSQGNTAPLLLGEFGGKTVDPKDREGVWFRSLMTYLQRMGVNYTYWSLNPNSGDTGGLLKDDWKTLDEGKLELLKGYQAPLIGSNTPSIIHTSIVPPR